MNSEESVPVELVDPRFPLYLRFTLTALGGMLIGLVITAIFLEPSEEGFGTHQKLGLPPCSFKVMFDGKPCPSCGMTTAWAHLVRGQFAASASANIGGMMLCIASIVVGPWLLVSGIIGRFWIGVPNEWVAISIAVGIFGTTLINWVIKLTA